MFLQQSTSQRIIKEQEAAKTATSEYSDWLVTTTNDSIRDELWCTPVPHHA